MTTLNKKWISLRLLLLIALGGMASVSAYHRAFAESDHEESKPAETQAEAAHEHGAEDEGDAVKHGEKADHKEKGEHEEKGHEDAGHEGEEEAIIIDPQSAADMNIEIVQAQQQTVQSSIPATGKISLNKNATAEVKARFVGVVKSVSKAQGETVKAGDTLATVESNDSLQVYEVTSPISGTILTRNANVGVIADEESLFTVSDLSSLWGEFHIFPKDIASVAAGQGVKIEAAGGDLVSEGEIVSLLPIAESESQTVVARVEVANADNKWRPGMSVHGDIFTSQKTVDVAVKVSAIQRIEGKPVVFVESNGKYEPRNVELGLQDKEWVEITSGLKAGERYVATGSFVVKAQAGKAGAEHAH